ncbi:MAG: NERD domain-containing protein [Isosphaeraceae bacterium]|nr:NERD domain-containing protein [Isosphaeraceae bacterium]
MKWISVAESNYPWEREALAFVRVGLPNHEPYRDWSNFEFIAEDGSINEVDLLVFGPMGFFLIEIKSRPGRLTGDAGTWFWEHDGRVVTTDNPLLAANSKAKKLKSLLARRRAFKTEGPPPFIEALVFCSAPDLRFELTGTAAFSVCVRDQPSGTRPGIRRAITERACPGITHSPRGRHDRPMAKLLDKAMEEAGIRSSIRSRRVIDFDLRKVIGEGPGYQDWAAAHASIPRRLRRVRLDHLRIAFSREPQIHDVQQ